MKSYLIKRFAQALLTVFVVTIIVFTMLYATGDPAALMAPMEASEEEVEELRVRLGLDRPFVEQYFMFFKSVIGLESGELTKSFRFKRNAMELVLVHLWRSFELSGVAIVISILVALPLGIWASVRRASLIDSAVLGFALIGQATPIFWLAIMLIWFFSVQLQWLPVSGRGTVAHFILPAASIAAYNMGILVRIVRSAMLEVLQEDYVMTARSKGLSELNVVINHAFRNGSKAVVSIVGLQVGILLSGALVIETIFAWPGLGKLMYDAVLQRDYPLVMTGTLVVAMLVAFVNVIIDISYAVLDPRIRYK